MRLTARRDEETGGARKHEAGLQFSMGPTLDEAENLHVATAGEIMGKLREFKIENIVINSCWSACPWYTRTANLCDRFIKEGARSVVGMWGRANELVVPELLHHFYRSLLLEGVDIETAVYKSRAALRANPDRWPKNQIFAEDFICVQYRRGPISTPVSQGQPLASGFRGFWRNLRLRNWSMSALSSHDSHSTRMSSTLHRPSQDVDTRHLYPVSLTDSNRLSVSRSTSHSALRLSRDDTHPHLVIIPLEILFLKLELSMMQHPLIWAYDVHYKQIENERRMQRLANMWLKTGFVRHMTVYRCEAFRSTPVGRPLLDLPKHPKKADKLAHPKSSKNMYVIENLFVLENVDRVVDGAGHNENDMNSAKKNLKSFLDKLDWTRDSVIFTTENIESWWQNQRWMGEHVGHWWSFQQIVPKTRRAPRRIPDA
jgi:hypothetical protein